MERHIKERNEIIAGILNRVGRFTTKTFIERLAVQKIILIAQTKMKDFPLSYNFRLYISGPYSSELANDLYNIKDTASYGTTEFVDEEQDRRYGLFAEKIKSYIQNRDILELVGTLFYLESKGFNDDKLIDMLRSIKSDFNEQCYVEAWELYNDIENIFN